MKDYFSEIDTALKSYEENKQYHRFSVVWIADRIDWCWKFKKITEAQKDNLAERAIALFNMGYM